MTALLLVGVVVVAAGSDWLSCCWHRAREAGRWKSGTLLAMLLELLGWAPVWLTIQTEDWRYLLASVVGSGVGTAVGLTSRTSQHS